MIVVMAGGFYAFLNNFSSDNKNKNLKMLILSVFK